MKSIFYIILFLMPLMSNAQFDWDDKNWGEKSLGFGCGASGSSTIPTIKMQFLFADKDFKGIKKELNSKLPADRFLATYLLEKLRKKKEIELSQSELEIIERIKISKEIVPVCSGCTYWDEVPLNQLLDKKHRIYKSAESWFKFYYKMYYNIK